MSNRKAVVAPKAPVKRTLEGEVISDKMQKTVVVKVTRTFMHPLLGKTVKRAKKYSVHDEKSLAKMGDWVEINETRPLSRTKHMTLSRVIRAANEGGL